jgi:hypothetical protein
MRLRLKIRSRMSFSLQMRSVGEVEIEEITKSEIVFEDKWNETTVR